MNYPIIVCQVPHQKKVFTRIVENDSDLYEFAQYEGGENWEYPGYYDENEEWINTSTVEDWKHAIAHDMHICYFIDKKEYLDGWHPASYHQSIQAKNEVDKLAEFLEWK